MQWSASGLSGETVILIVAAVVLVAVAAVRLSSRTGLPVLLLYLGLGMLLGEDGIGLQFDDASLTHDLGYAALVLILAEGGLTARWATIRPVLAPAAVLATVGTLVSLLVVGGVAWLLFGLDPVTALLLGAALMRLNGLAASIATFAFLAIVNSVYSNWDSVTGGTSSLIGIPNSVTVWVALGFAAIWAVGDAVDVNVAKEFAVIGLFQSLIFAVLGWRLSRALMFPILYTWLMLPVGESLYPLLQRIATQLSVFFLSLTPLPVFNEDSVIYVTSGTYRIAEVCAGLNFIFATIALSLIYGTMMYGSLLKRVACVAIMLPIAIVGNGFRIFLIIYANHYLGSNIDIVGDHYFYCLLYTSDAADE